MALIWPHRAIFSEKQHSFNQTWLIKSKENLSEKQGRLGHVLTALFAVFSKHAQFLKFSAFSLFLFLPLFVYAGPFSFILDNFFNSNDGRSTYERVVNTQTMALLQAAVNLDPNPAKGGGDITIVANSALVSENGPSGTIADVELSYQNNGEISLYVVREGDSLGSIAKIFGVSVNTIAWANDIRGSVIRPGQTLVILPISGIKHKVVKGDTIASLAKKYKGDAKEIAQFNDIDENSSLALGTEIIIPDGVIATPAASVSRTSSLRGGGGPRFEGYYIWPVLGGRKTQGLHGYNGIDIGAPVGTPVVAAASGEVIISRNYGWNGGYGNYIVVKHPNGTQTLYGHLSSNIVFGGPVSQGQIIGYVGATGKSTGPHLHFEVRGATNPF